MHSYTNTHTLHSSLRWVDLRLLYPIDITRSMYERELGWANGYLPHSHTLSSSLLTSSHLTHPHHNLHTTSDKVSMLHIHTQVCMIIFKIYSYMYYYGIYIHVHLSQETSSRHSDDVMSESHDPARPHLPATPLSSSSSRRSSVTDGAAMTTEAEGRERGSGVVEWRAGTTNEQTTVVGNWYHCGIVYIPLLLGYPGVVRV